MTQTPPNLSLADAVAALHTAARLQRGRPGGEAPVQVPLLEEYVRDVVERIESSDWLRDAPRAPGRNEDVRVASRIGQCWSAPLHSA